MSTISDLREGVAGLLVAAGVGVRLTDPTAVYPSTGTAIVGGIMPSEPDRAVALTLFKLLMDPTYPGDRYLLQVRSRGLPNDDDDAADLDEACQNALNNVTYRTFGTANVTQILFYSSVPLGQDAGTRSTYSTKYFIDVDVPPTSLRPAGGWD